LATFKARYNDGVSARTAEVEVTVTAEGLAIRAAGPEPVDVWPAKSVTFVETPQAGLPVRLRRLDRPEARIMIQDRAALDPLKTHFPNLRRGARPTRRSIVRIGALFAAAAASVAILVAVVIPELATQIARAIPPEIERRVGDGVADHLALLLGASAGRRPAPACTAPDGVAALSTMLGRLSPAPVHELAPMIRVIDSRLVNAFALPGAIILLPRGMIDFSRTPEELAGILAHELGHIVLRHPTENLIKVAGVSTLFSLLIGDVAGGTVIVAVGEYMIRTSYTRPAEEAADEFAIARLRRAAIDPTATAAAFERLLPKETGSSTFEKAFSTHPPTAARVERFRAAALPAARPILNDAEWAAVKGMCQASRTG
jgi:hypothetical protein